MGVTIKEIESGIFLFQIYHVEDLNWVLNGGPWSLDMLAMEIVPSGDNPTKTALNSINLWVQVHDLPSGFMTVTIGK